MPYRAADRVKETSTTTGTGTYSLAGAAAGFRTFVAGIGDDNRCTYCVENGTDWEINEGTVNDASPDTLTRDKLLASSTGSAINWSAGTRNVFAVYAAAQQQPQAAALTSDYTNNSTTGTEVTGLSQVSIQPGSYRFEYDLICRSAATATGLSLGINFTGTHTALVARMEYGGTGTTASTGIADDDSAGATDQMQEHFTTRSESTTAPDLGPLTGFTTAGADTYVRVLGVIVVTAAGDLELWCASEVASSQVDIRVGSSVLLWRTS